MAKQKFYKALSMQPRVKGKDRPDLANYAEPRVH